MVLDSVSSGVYNIHPETKQFRKHSVMAQKIIQ
jgi:hypothetical protein